MDPAHRRIAIAGLRTSELRGSPGRSVTPSAPPEERTVAKTDTAGIVARRQAGRRPAGGVQARNAATSIVEHGAVGVGDETAEREGCVDGAVVDPEINRSDA